MNTEPSPDQPLLPLPAEVDQRLSYWHGLWNRSASYHYFFGVISVGASVISTSMEGDRAKIFSIIAAIATALIGFMHPERRYAKFVRAWRVLDVAAMRYRHGLCDKASLIDAVERGEALIADYEDRADATPDKAGVAGATDVPVPAAEAPPGESPQQGAGPGPTDPPPTTAAVDAADRTPPGGAAP
jgi:hypothetical protein